VAIDNIKTILYILVFTYDSSN